MRLRVLTASDIDALLPMRDAIQVNAGAYVDLSMGRVQMPQRLALQTDDGVVLFMPALQRSSGNLGMKVVSVFPHNTTQHLPTIHALVLVIDPDTGVPQALLNGTRLTALRTGAGAGAATQVLAREDSRVMAMFGAGGQAMDQVEAVLAVRPVEEVRIYTPSGASAERLARRLQERYPDRVFRRVADPGEAVRGADIITCATTSSTPVFAPEDVSPGAHINGVGSFTPSMREVQIVGLPHLRVFVDSVEAARAEAGDLIQAVAEGHLRWDDVIEIGQVLAGQQEGRRSRDEITFFKSVGVAVQDAATAGAVVRRALDAHVGELVEL